MVCLRKVKFNIGYNLLIMNLHPIVLITGATKGIGRAIADRFAESSAELHVVARSSEDLEAMKVSLERPGMTVRTYVSDLSVAEEVKELVGVLRSNLKKLDVLVNNAGIYLPGSLLEEDSNNLPYMMQLNVLCHYDITRGLADLMVPGSHIINVASVASRKLFFGKPSYSISKHAQATMVDAFRNEFRPLGIRVTSVMPGPTWSASWEGVEFPEERLLKAKHIADVVWSAWSLPVEAVIEEIMIRPFEGDIE